MRLVVEMRKLALLLPYETVDQSQSGGILEGLGVTPESDGNDQGGSLVSLGSARVENVSFTLDVFPDSLALDAALGNLVALYEVSHHCHYRAWIASVGLVVWHPQETCSWMLCFGKTFVRSFC
jgi:hypothetical protein